MEEIDKLVSKVATALETAVNNHGSKAVELTLEAARIMALQQLVTGFILLALAAAFGLLGWRVIVRGFKYVNDATSYRDYDGSGHLFGGALSVAAGLLLMAISLADLGKAVNWIGVSRPEVYIAYNVVSKLIK